jgi:hypothetical protein
LTAHTQLAIYSQVDIRYFIAGSGRNPTLEFIVDLPADLAAEVQADIAEVGEHPEDPAVVWRWITGASPMREIKTRDYRTFFFIEAGIVWVINCCKKQDQEHAIEVARERMKELRKQIADYVGQLRAEAEKK